MGHYVSQCDDMKIFEKCSNISVYKFKLFFFSSILSLSTLYRPFFHGLLASLSLISHICRLCLTRPTLSQFRSFKIRRTTFPNYIKFCDLLILRLKNGKKGRSGSLAYFLFFSLFFDSGFFESWQPYLGIYSPNSITDKYSAS